MSQPPNVGGLTQRVSPRWQTGEARSWFTVVNNTPHLGGSDMSEKKKIDPKAPTTKSSAETDESRTEEERTSQRVNQRVAQRVALRTSQKIFL
jgi:hypothetical protein